jgi:hypothetical protein
VSPTRDDVERLAEALDASGDLRVIPDTTEEHDWGWIIYLQTRAWIASRDFEDMLIGHGPMLITRSGRMFALGSGAPWHAYGDALRVAELGGSWWQRLRARGRLRELDACEQPREHLRRQLACDRWASEMIERWWNDTEGGTARLA